MSRNQKRKNPGTPSPRKRSTRTSKRRMGQNSDILLPGGALQTTFPVEASQPPAEVDAVAGTSQISAVPVRAQTTTTQRTVTFASSPSLSPIGNTPGLRKRHQEDPSDPFVADTENAAAFETFQLSAISDSDEDVPETPRRPRSPVSPTATPSRRQRRAQKKAIGPAGNRRSKRADDVLSFFVVDKDNTKTCSFCMALKRTNRDYKIHVYGSQTGSNNLRLHLAKIHPDEWISELKKRNLTVTAKAGLKALASLQGKTLETPSRPSYSPELFVDTLVDFIVATDQSLSIIESKEFRFLLLLLRENFEEKDIPHRTTIRTRILERKTESLEILSTQMQRSLGKISFTTDMWSDPDRKAYMAVTAHWMENHQEHINLRADLLGFINVPGSHTGERLAEVFLFIIDRLDIDKKIGWITVDNAANNDTCMTAIQNSLKLRDIIFNDQERHIRCFPHIINLACKAMLDAVAHYDSFDDPITKLRDIIQYAINRFSIEYQLDASLSPTDWQTLQTLHEILEIPHSYQQLLSAEKTPTLCGTIPAFEGVIKTLEQFQDSNILSFHIVGAGIDKLKEYQAATADTPAYILAILLNPSMNLEWFTEQKPYLVPLAKILLYGALAPFQRPRSAHHIQSTENVKPSKSLAARKKLGLVKGSSHQSDDGDHMLQDEIKRYFSVQVDVDTDIITFWKNNQHLFPTSFRLAMDILPIQASSVPCERVFSSSKETTTARRNKLSPQLVEALQVLKFEHKHNKTSKTLNFTAGLDMDDEMKELETIEEAQPVEDLDGLFQSLHYD